MIPWAKIIIGLLLLHHLIGI